MACALAVLTPSSAFASSSRNINLYSTDGGARLVGTLTWVSAHQWTFSGTLADVKCDGRTPEVTFLTNPARSDAHVSGTIQNRNGCNKATVAVQKGWTLSGTLYSVVLEVGNATSSWSYRNDVTYSIPY